MDPAAFLADLEAKPAALLALLDHLPSWPDVGTGPIVLTGMGSSWFAADVAARRLRCHGIHAIAELASVEATLPSSPDLTMIGVTASGTSAETVELLEAHAGISRTIVVTNNGEAALPSDHTVLMRAGVEAGGVACCRRLRDRRLEPRRRLPHQDTRLPRSAVHRIALRRRRVAVDDGSLQPRRHGWFRACQRVCQCALSG